MFLLLLYLSVALHTSYSFLVYFAVRSDWFADSVAQDCSCLSVGIDLLFKIKTSCKNLVKLFMIMM